MPSFCRHGRFIENCPICSKAERARPGTVEGTARTRADTPSRPPSRSGTRTATPRRTSNLTVRRVARAADDGYDQPLVPGLRASADAVRLADELAFAEARLAQLAGPEAPGTYARARSLGGEDGLWLTFQLALASPREDGDPFAAIDAAATDWTSGELPALEGDVLGPRAGVDPRRGGAETLAAYRTRAERAGGQVAWLAGEPGYAPGRRFDRAFERLSLPGLGRTARYEFLVVAGRLGLLDVDPTGLQLSAEALDPTSVAAKRIFGIGDPILIGRRAGELVQATDVPFAALDLAVQNWGRLATAEPPRITAGSTAEADPQRRDRIAAALRVA